jgi:hypothetical protein
MPLEGNLRDFDLPDIFQLIAKQKKTGVLNIASGESQGAVMFARGDIVFARKTGENVQTMLANFLIVIKRLSRDEVAELMLPDKRSLQACISDLVTRNYCTAAELEEVWRMGIEDIACSLFLWDEGSFRFEADDAAGKESFNNITFSTEAVTMEAMRRIDEWKVMREFFDEQTVFLPADPAALADLAAQNAQCAHILHLLNGRRTIADISRRSFLAIFRIHEYLFDLWKKNQIVQAQSETVFPEQHAQTRPAFPLLGATSLALTAAVCLLLVSFLLGRVVLPGTLLAARDAAMQNTRYGQDEIKAVAKVRIAALTYQAQDGAGHATLELLLKAGLINRHDIGLYTRAHRSDHPGPQ